MKNRIAAGKQAPPAKAKKPVPKREKGRLKAYFKGVRTETKKVIWPTREELISYTWVVLLTCTAFALIFWAFDSAVLAALRAILNINI